MLWIGEKDFFVSFYELKKKKDWLIYLAGSSITDRRERYGSSICWFTP